MISHILLATYPAFALHFQRRIPRNFVLIFPRIGSGSPPGPRCGTRTAHYSLISQNLLLAGKLKKPVSQSCPVCGNFWWATGQSNLADKRLPSTKVSKVWFSYSHNCTMSNGTVQFSFCLPSLIVQWPSRIFHSYLLRMIVKLAYWWLS